MSASQAVDYGLVDSVFTNRESK
ncbi:hypothetical protein P4S68_22340 [Pseudoalteromonas sp. Hal099]